MGVHSAATCSRLGKKWYIVGFLSAHEKSAMMSDEADLSTYFIDIFQDPAGDEGRVAGRDTVRDPA